MPSVTVITAGSIVRAVPQILAAHMDREIALLSIPRGRYFGLNSSGAKIWDWIQQPISVGELLAKLLEVYEVDESQLKFDLHEMLEQLAQAQLIEIECEPSSAAADSK